MMIKVKETMLQHYIEFLHSQLTYDLTLFISDENISFQFSTLIFHTHFYLIYLS